MSPPGLTTLLRTNLAGRPFRHGLLILAAASAVGLIVAASLIDRASRAGLTRGMERLGADLVAVPRGLDQEVERAYITGEAALFYMDRAIQDRIAAHDFVAQTSPQLYLKSLTGASCCSSWNVFLIGFDPATDFTVRPWLAERPDRSVAPDQVLVGAALSSPAGTALKFYGHDFTVAGALAPSGLGLDLSIFIPLETAYRMAEGSRTLAEEPLTVSRGQLSAVMIRLKPEGEGGLSPAKAAFQLEQEIPELTVIQPADMTVMVQQNLRHTLAGLRAAGFAVWPLTALLIGLIFALAAAERRRELGLLRALGATRAFLFRLILAEAVLIAAAGAVLGLAAALGLVFGFSRLIAKSLAVPFAWPRPADLALLLFAALGLALLTGALAALYPALVTSRMEPYEAVRRGE